MGSWSNTCSSSIRWTQDPWLTALSSQPSPGGRADVNKRAKGPRGIPNRPIWAHRPSASLQQLGWPAHVPTCANEQHCIGGSIKPCDPVSHHVGEVGVLLYEQGPAPARLHLLLHQGVFLDEVERVVGQLQRAGVAMVAVPVVDALGLGLGEGGQPLGMALGLRAAVHLSLGDSPSLAAGWVLGQYSCPTSGIAHGTPCRGPRTPSEYLPAGTRRLPTGPHHPYHSKGGTPRARLGVHFSPVRGRWGKAGPSAKWLWARTV